MRKTLGAINVCIRPCRLERVIFIDERRRAESMLSKARMSYELAMKKEMASRTWIPRAEKVV